MDPDDPADTIREVDSTSFHQPVVTPHSPPGSYEWTPPPASFRREPVRKYNALSSTNTTDSSLVRGLPAIEICAGPIVRYSGQRSGIEFWKGSVLLVTNDQQPVSPGETVTSSSFPTSSSEESWTVGSSVPPQGAPATDNAMGTTLVEGDYIPMPPMLPFAARAPKPPPDTNTAPPPSAFDGLELDDFPSTSPFLSYSVVFPWAELADPDAERANKNVTANVTPRQDPPERVVRRERLRGQRIHQEYGRTFWRFSLLFELDPTREMRVYYTINGDAAQGDFYLPAQSQSMRVVFYSCNGFSLSVDPDNYRGCLWKDVLRHHMVQRYHVMIGGGDQIYCDAVREACKPIREWANEKSKERKNNMPFESHAREATEQFFLEFYIAWFGDGWWQGRTVLEPEGKDKGKVAALLHRFRGGRRVSKLYRCLRPNFPVALASIPSINMLDDHDIFDGFGSYADSTMSQPVFSGLGEVAFKYYMLFQHHTHPDEDPSVDPSWMCNTARIGPYIHYPARSVFSRLGLSLAVAALDCRTERRFDTIISHETYRFLLNRIRAELLADRRIRHLLVVVGIPMAYPRLVWLEKALDNAIVKKPLRGLARLGVLSGWKRSGYETVDRENVASSSNEENHFTHNSRAVNTFDGAAEILDDLNDHWCASMHKQERNQMIVDLQEVAETTSTRITILSGDVHLAGVGRFYSQEEEAPRSTTPPVPTVPVAGSAEAHEATTVLKPNGTRKLRKSSTKFVPPDETIDWELDHRLMLNVISSAITNAPPSRALANFLDTRNKVHYLASHTSEDMVHLFKYDVDGTPRHRNRRLLARRNWCSIVEIGSESGGAIPGGGTGPGSNPICGVPRRRRRPPQYPRAYTEVYGGDDPNPLAPSASPMHRIAQLVTTGRTHHVHYRHHTRSQTAIAAGPRFPELFPEAADGYPAPHCQAGQESAPSVPAVPRAPFACDEREPRYPDRPGALSIVLHVERDAGAPTGETRPYEVVAPLLYAVSPPASPVAMPAPSPTVASWARVPGAANAAATAVTLAESARARSAAGVSASASASSAAQPRSLSGPSLAATVRGADGDGHVWTSQSMRGEAIARAPDPSSGSSGGGAAFPGATTHGTAGPPTLSSFRGRGFRLRSMSAVGNVDRARLRSVSAVGSVARASGGAPANPPGSGLGAGPSSTGSDSSARPVPSSASGIGAGKPGPAPGPPSGAR